jgi:hypothetical protein
VIQAKQNVQVISFTRWLVDNLLEDWLKILADLEHIIISSNNDIVSWKFGKKKVVSL